jgi:predicted TIM-barrel fold metal-dependent hydrolase
VTTTTDSDTIKIISVDDHLIEPPTLWQERLPQKYREIGPRVVRSQGVGELMDGKLEFKETPDGRQWDVWLYEDKVVPLHGIQFGAEPTEMTAAEAKYPKPTTYDTIRPGCYRQKERLEDMDLNGVEASICFPNMFVRFAGQVFLEAKDKDLALLSLRVYNDWVIEEWCNGSGGRLIPLCVVPLWDPKLAAEEVERVATLGCRAITFTELPAFLGLPSIHSGHWDGLFAACAETGTVVNVHIGSGSKFFTTSLDAPFHTMACLNFINPAMSITDWVFSGLLQRHENLRVMFAESQIGWIPYLLERMDRTWQQYPNFGWKDGKSAKEVMPLPPSHYFKDHVLCAFFDDAHGLRSLDEIGVDVVAFETDYPHSDGTWPNSPKVAEKLLDGCSDDIRRKVLRDNAIRFFDLAF